MNITAGLTIAEIHAAYRAGAKPSQMLSHAYAQIEAAHDPGIFITLRSLDDCLADAKRLPDFDPKRMPLWGIPFAVKDNIDVAGLPTTCACPEFAYIAERSATAVAKLVAAGAIVIGKTNLDQFATGLVGVRTPYPVPRNAIDPDLVPGGSSSGSAVAVARGIVPFALGTDTAGSGRVPAGLNNIVGLKPSVGAVSSAGMVPACRTLDCISVFAGTVDDAWAVCGAMAGADADDPFSRPIALGALGEIPPQLTLAIPQLSDLKFFGDRFAEEAFQAATERLSRLGARLRPVTMAPLYEAAAILYEGSWVAERHAALLEFMTRKPDAMHPVTRRIVEGAACFSATDAFTDLYRLADLRITAAKLLDGCDALVVPTSPSAPRLSDLTADPYGPNAQLGTYTNFVNLLDMAAISVPGPWRSDRRAAGVTLIGLRGTDANLAAIGRTMHHRDGATIGATGRQLPPPLPAVHANAAGMVEIVVVGAHLSGLELNQSLVALGGRFARAVRTEPIYKLFALSGGPPRRAGIVRAENGGAAIEAEVWALPETGFARFVTAIPDPLGVGTVHLEDGSRPKGFLMESIAARNARDITSFGGWRAYIESPTAMRDAKDASA